MSTPRELKVFEISVAAEEDRPAPFPFALRFVRKDTGEEATYEFEAFGDPGAGADLTLSSIVQYDDRGRQVIDLNGLLRFFNRVMSDEDYQRLKDLLDDKAVTIHIDQIAAVFNWLVEEYTGRPIVRSTLSSGGPPKNGRRSTATRS